MSTSSCLEPFLHPRLLAEALPLFHSGFHRQAAFEAIKQVELALRDRAGADSRLYGVRLVRQIFDNKRGFYLHLSLDQNQQEAGRLLFEGAFRYYRNYMAHDGAKVTPVLSGRLLVIASELLDMLGASERRLGGKAGLDQLVTSRFGNPDSLVRALRALDGEWFGDDVVDGFFETLAKARITDDQFMILVETGPIEVNETPAGDPEFDTFTRFKLTRDGEQAVEWLTQVDHVPANE